VLTTAASSRSRDALLRLSAAKHLRQYQEDRRVERSQDQEGRPETDRFGQ
jgi:hypothetical protein